MFWNKKDIYNILRDMDDKMDRHDKENDVRLDSIEKVLIVQEQNLKQHMKRSDNLEKIINSVKEKDLDPLKKHVNMVEGAMKFIGILGVLVSIVGGTLRAFGII